MPGDSLGFVVTAIPALPNEVEALKALLLATREEAQSAVRRADESEARLANALARESARDALIAHLQLQIAKLKREQYGASAERTRRLLDQMELQLEELETGAGLKSVSVCLSTAYAPMPMLLGSSVLSASRSSSSRICDSESPRRHLRGEAMTFETRAPVTSRSKPNGADRAS